MFNRVRTQTGQWTYYKTMIITFFCGIDDNSYFSRSWKLPAELKTQKILKFRSGHAWINRSWCIQGWIWLYYCRTSVVLPSHGSSSIKTRFLCLTFIFYHMMMNDDTTHTSKQMSRHHLTRTSINLQKSRPASGGSSIIIHSRKWVQRPTRLNGVETWNRSRKLVRILRGHEHLLENQNGQTRCVKEAARCVETGLIGFVLKIYKFTGRISRCDILVEAGARNFARSCLGHPFPEGIHCVGNVRT